MVLAAFNKEKALVGAFSVIVKLQTLQLQSRLLHVFHRFLVTTFGVDMIWRHGDMRQEMRHRTGYI